MSLVTPDRPTFYKDMTEVFWNSNGSGKDEVGKDGVGILQKAEGGRRYELGQWPTTDTGWSRTSRCLAASRSSSTSRSTPREGRVMPDREPPGEGLQEPVRRRGDDVFFDRRVRNVLQCDSSESVSNRMREDSPPNAALLH